MNDTGERAPSRMLIGRERLFYSGLVGNTMTTRRLGAVTIYAAPDSHLEISIDGGPWRRQRIAAVAAFVPHRLRTPSGRIATVCFEPETVDPGEAAALIAGINDGPEDERLVRRILAARREVTRTADAGGFTAAEFDRFFLRRPLKPRAIDGRVRHVLARLLDELPEAAIPADDCAADVGLSTSRFLHLFKDEAGSSFRTQRMWKRARRFMDHANGEDSLTDVALGLGYPDSSHFSHTIRAAFGLKPRSIREGSRGMLVCLGEDYSVAGGYD
jgi:AraC-like DNA-binding protein